MNRFFWGNGELGPDESMVLQKDGVCLYDGDTRTSFTEGRSILTTHNLLWWDSRDSTCRMLLPLASVVKVKGERGGIGKSDKIVIFVGTPRPGMEGGRPPVPVSARSSADSVKLSFRRAGQQEFLNAIEETLRARCWMVGKTDSRAGPKRHVGIVGIERSLAAKHQQVDESISQAFEDLDALMKSARDMVTLSNSIADKLREKKGELTDDETVKFKSYLLSLGMADPVTRNSHPGGKYFTELARQLAKTLENIIRQRGGVITLADAYCIVNRARGMELLSPDDLISASRVMSDLHLPVVLKVFTSGVMVLQLASHSDEETLKDTVERLNNRESLTASEMARMASLPVVLAQERLTFAEDRGMACRDDTEEGLRFFPNLFATRMA